MGDHFVFLVDRLLTESTLEAAIESRNLSYGLNVSENDTMIEFCSNSNMDHEGVFSTRKLVECRICQDEDFDSNMEIPCSCCGTLKQFRPGYTAPPPVFRLGGIPANFRGHWQITRRDMIENPQIIRIVSSDHNFLDQEYDEYADSTARNVICFRTVAVIFMILLILRHTLPTFANGVNNYSLPVFLLLLIRTSGVIVPIYIIVKASTAFIHRRQRLMSIASSASTSSLSSSDEEAGPTPLQHQP